MTKPRSFAINGNGQSSDEPFERLSICLVTALTVADFIDPDLITDAHTNTGAQIGVLTLAALLREQGFKPIFFNLDDLFYDFIGRDGSTAQTDTGLREADEDASEFFFP